MRGSGCARCWTSSPTGSDARRARELAELGELVARRPTPFGNTPTRKRALRLRPGCGIGLARSHREIMPRYAPRGDRARRPPRRADARARRHSVAERRRGGDPRAPARRSCLAGWVGRVRGRRGVPLRPHRGGAGVPLIVLAAHYDTVPAQGNLPGRLERRRRARARRERHEGRPRGRARARARSRPRGSTTCDVALLLFGREELPAEHNPLPALFDGLRARCTRRRSRSSSSRPTWTIQAGCLGNVVARAHLPRDERPLGAAVARRQRARAGRARPRAAARARAARRRRRRARVPRGGLRHAARGRYRRQRHPGRGDRHAEPPLPARSRARGGGGVSRRARPGRSDARDRRATPRRRAWSRRLARSCARSARPASSTIEPKQAWTNVADFTARGLDAVNFGPGHTALRAPRGRARRDRRARARAYEVLERFLTSPIGEDGADGARDSASTSCGRAASSIAEPIEEAIARLDRGDVRVAERGRRRLGRQRVGEEGDPPLLPPAQGRADGGRRPPLPRQDPGQVRLRRARRARRAARASRATARSCPRASCSCPGFVNIGAWVGPRTMVDTWATVGSCAQIGADVHLSGGVGIGGVLEPPQARPVIVEDGAFVGSRAVVVEGVVVGEGAVIAPNVVLSASIPVIDVTGAEPVEHRGYVPPRSVVLPGTRPKDYPAGTLRPPVRAHRRHAERVDRPQDVAERRPARVRDRDVSEPRRDRALHRRRRRRRAPSTARSSASRPVAEWPGGADLRRRRREAPRPRALGAQHERRPAERGSLRDLASPTSTRLRGARVPTGPSSCVEPRDYPWGRSAYLRDPDGRLVELAQA